MAGWPWRWTRPGARRAPRATCRPGPRPKPEVDQVRQEWQACVDTLVHDRVIDPAAIGYWGLSMGISLLAAESRIRCAVIGLMHTRYYERILADVAQIACPLRFRLHWDDSRVPRLEAFDLFDAIGSPNKRLHAYRGDHGAFSDEEIVVSERFLAAHTSPTT